MLSTLFTSAVAALLLACNVVALQVDLSDPSTSSTRDLVAGIAQETLQTSTNSLQLPSKIRPRP